jgi:branched-subunit amino acid transport protein AzlD
MLVKTLFVCPMLSFYLSIVARGGTGLYMVLIRLF